MIEKILEYGGVIFAAVGILCLFLEAFAIFKRDSNPKLTIVGLVFLGISVIGFLITDVILREADVPYFLTIIWIAFLWVYLICNLVSAVLVSKSKRADKRKEQNELQVASTDADEQQVNPDEQQADEIEKIQT